MFYESEDIIPAILLTQKIFGKNNNWIYDRNKKFLKNVAIATREYGKLWYGDLELTEDLQRNLNLLSDSLNQRVYIINGFNFYSYIKKSNNQLKKVESEIY